MNSSPYPDGSLPRLQSAEQDIIAIIDKICRENDIDYFIDGGTCLGAVRHGGFIPWDDDIDIGMPAPDYVRFCAIAPNELPKGYSLHTSSNTKGFSALWAKVFKDNTRFIDDNACEAGCEQGIFVDVFPYAQLDDDCRKAQAQRKTARLAQLKSYLKHFSRPKLPANMPAKGVALLACKCVHNTIARTWKQEDLQRQFNHVFDTAHPSQQWINVAYPADGTYDSRVLFPTKDITFGDLTLRAPNDCDKFLETLYGDYMELPPESKRYTHAPIVLDFGNGINVMSQS